MTEGTYQWDSKHIPTVGKDHLVLADWRLSIPTKKWKQGSAGKETGVFEYEFERDGKKAQTVKMESGADTPFPSLNDDQFLIALMTLSEMAGCPEVLLFEPSHLLQLLRRSDNQGNLNRAHQALVRYRAMTTHFEGIWFDRSTRSVELDFTTGIIADLGWGSGKGRRRKQSTRSCRLQWTESFHDSMKNGNLLNINLVDLTSLNKRTTAQQLFRITNKAWHGGRKPSVFEMEVKDLACGHLRMKDTKFARRNLLEVISFIEGQGFYKKATPAERCYQLARGIWRVRLELHPEKTIESKTKKIKNTAVATTEARQLVTAYTSVRFNRSSYSPTLKEIACAERLLKDAPIEELTVITAQVATQVKSQNAADKYFGFAEPYYIELLQQNKTAAKDATKRATGAATVHEQANKSDQHRLAKEKRWHQLKLEFASASFEEQKKCFELALARDSAPAYRKRIEESTIDNPAPEVIRELEILLEQTTV